MLAMLAGGCNAAVVPGDGSLVVFDVDGDFSRRVAVDSSGVTRSELEAVRIGVHAWNMAGARFALADETGSMDAAVVHFGLHRSSGLNVDGVCWPGLNYASIYADHVKDYHSPAFEALSATVAHELGHALGLEHTREVAVMNPTENKAALTGSDLAAFAARWR